MWFDPSLQNLLIREQILHAREQAARRHVVRQAKTASVRRPWEVVQRLVRAVFTRSRERRLERTVLP